MKQAKGGILERGKLSSYSRKQHLNSEENWNCPPESSLNLAGSVTHLSGRKKMHGRTAECESLSPPRSLTFSSFLEIFTFNLSACRVRCNELFCAGDSYRADLPSLLCRCMVSARLSRLSLETSCSDPREMLDLGDTTCQNLDFFGHSRYKKKWKPD